MPSEPSKTPQSQDGALRVFPVSPPNAFRCYSVIVSVVETRGGGLTKEIGCPGPKKVDASGTKKTCARCYSPARLASDKLRPTSLFFIFLPHKHTHDTAVGLEALEGQKRVQRVTKNATLASLNTVIVSKNPFIGYSPAFSPILRIN